MNQLFYKPKTKKQLYPVYSTYVLDELKVPDQLKRKVSLKKLNTASQ